MVTRVFHAESRFIPETGGRHLQARIRCRKCHRVEWANCPNPSFAIRVFRGRGWLLGSKDGRDVCPGCLNQQEKRPELTGPQRRAAWNAIEARLDAKEASAALDAEAVASVGPAFNPAMAEALAPLAEAMKVRKQPTGYGSGTGYTNRSNTYRAAKRAVGNPDAKNGVHFNIINEPGGTFGFELIPTPADTAPAVIEKEDTTVNTQPAPPRPTIATAAAPPKPTPADNRRIIEALDAHYNVDDGMYREAFTDASLAAKLNLPRKRVTDLRDSIYGPEANEAAAQRLAELDVASEMATAAVERLTEMAIEAEEIARKLREAAAKATR